VAAYRGELRAQGNGYRIARKHAGRLRRIVQLAAFALPILLLAA
jgi:hypothetical protein